MKLHFKYSSRLDQYAQTAMTDANSAQHSTEIFAINKKRKEKKEEDRNKKTKETNNRVYGMLQYTEKSFIMPNTFVLNET